MERSSIINLQWNETQNNDIPQQERARKCKLVLEYYKNNHKIIGRVEDFNPTEEAVIELLKIRSIHLTRWLNMVAYNKIESPFL